MLRHVTWLNGVVPVSFTTISGGCLTLDSSPIRCAAVHVRQDIVVPDASRMA